MAATDPTVADLVHQYRVERNRSRERLAREMHKSISWLAQVEPGELGLTDVTVLDRFATLLGAPLAEFIDAALGPSTERPASGHTSNSSDWPWPGIPCPTPSPRAQTPLPAATSTPCNNAATTPGNYCTQAPTASSALFSPRCWQTLKSQAAPARRPSGPVSIPFWPKATKQAPPCWLKSVTAAPDGSPPTAPSPPENAATARHVLIQATRRRDAIIANGDPGLISLAGSSALLLAVLLARNADARGADHSINAARELATALGGDHNHGTEFGPTNVVMHAVAVAVELGNGQQALDRATHIRSTAHMSTERQARYLVDLARAHILTRSPTQALEVLIKAEHIAPEELAETPPVAAVIEDIEAQTKHARQPALRRLKQRLYT
ncbi:MAG: hypothetical protein QOD10_1848 [Mycobacterium sp.]|nr:hypothetical protein [Mycobacterium sp.]